MNNAHGTFAAPRMSMILSGQFRGFFIYGSDVMNRQKLLVVATCLGLFAFSLTALAQVGGWSKAEVDDPEVVAAAKFALRETQKTTDSKLTLTKIVSAKQQLVAGMNYAVTLQVAAGGDEPIQREAEAVVYKNLDDEYSLTSWKWKKAE